jgi:hypothetical protein
MRISELLSEGPLGALAGNFVKGATSGRIDPTNKDIGLGAQIGSALAASAGLSSTADLITQTGYKNTAQQTGGTQGTTGAPKINPNQPVDLPPLGKVKLKPTPGGGVEIDTRGTDLANKAGIPKLNIDRQTLQQMQTGTTRR